MVKLRFFFVFKQVVLKFTTGFETVKLATVLNYGFRSYSKRYSALCAVNLQMVYMRFGVA